MRFDIPKFNDPVAALREDVRSYLAKNHVKQKALARLAETTEQTISDFLGKRERGLMAETFARLSFIVANDIVPKSNRIVHAQSFGQPVPDIVLDDAEMAEFKTEHTQALFDQERLDVLNHNIGTQYDLSRLENQ
jgi:hypothetical protein